MKASIFAALLTAFGSFPLWAAPKTDVIQLKNGDRVTGEIKSLARGQLELSTDSMGTILIEWEQVEEVLSLTGQAIELTSGERFYGILEKPEALNVVRINSPEGTVGVASDDIISMYPVEAGIWASQSDFGISSGLGYKF